MGGIDDRLRDLEEKVILIERAIATIREAMERARVERQEAARIRAYRPPPRPASLPTTTSPYMGR